MLIVKSHCNVFLTSPSVVLAASVIRMFFHSLSEATFHKGLKIYLTSNPDGVALPENLYDALQQAANGDETQQGEYEIRDLFGSWETQAGYPIVYVERSYNNHMIRFTQVRGKIKFCLLTFRHAAAFPLVSESIYGFGCGRRSLGVALAYSNYLCIKG